MALITGLKGGTTNITVSYGGKTATFSNFTVNKKTVTFSAPTLKTVSPYTRSSQTLVNTGSCTTGGTMYYYVSTSSSTPTFSASSWTTTAPSKINAGTYYLWYYVYVSDTNTYTGTGINTVTKVGTGSVTIPKQTPVLSTTPTKRADWTYNGTEYALASGGAMKHSSTDSTAVAGTFTYAKGKNAGSYTASWSFTPTDTTNYNSTSGNVGTVTVSKATPTFTTTNGSVEYHNTAYAKGKPSVAGKIYWGTSTSSMTSTVSASANTNTNITSRTAVGTTTIYAYFVPTDTTNYNSVGSSSSGYKTITAEVTKATDASVTVTLDSAGTYGSTATLVTAAHSSSHGTSAAYIGYKYGSAATADNQITWVSVGTALTLSETASAGTYYIYKKWTADSNHSNSQTYTQVGTTYTLSRSKADQVVSIRRSATIYVHSGHTYNNTVNVDATGIGTITYSSSATGKATVNSSGLVTAVAAGTATITATAAGNTNYKSGSASCTVTIRTDTYIDNWNKPSISVYSYPNISAGGGTSTPTVNVTQSGTRNWASGYSESLSNSTFTYSYSMTTGNGFSINTTNGKITADSRGTTPGSERSSNTATVTVTGSGVGEDSTKTATAVCKQVANSLTGISISLGNSSISYNSTTTATVTATYTSGSSKDVTSSLSTSSSATSNFIKSGDTSVVTVS